MNNSHVVKLYPKFQYLFDPTPPKVPKNFPRRVNLNELDIFTQNTFSDQYLEAQKNGCPYYLLAVTESKSDSESNTPPVYTIYDSASLRSYRIQSQNKSKPLVSPLTNLPIQKIYYLAIECFKLSQNPNSSTIEFIPRPLKEVKLAKFFNPEIYHPDNNIELALDALNHHIDSTTPVLFSQVKRCQNVISKYLNSLMKKDLPPNMVSSSLNDNTPSPQHALAQRFIQHLQIEAQKWSQCSHIKPFLPPLPELNKVAPTSPVGK